MVVTSAAVLRSVTTQSQPDQLRHTRAVAQTMLWAQEAARSGNYQEALSWLRVLEAVEDRLPPAVKRLQDEWRAIVERRAECHWANKGANRHLGRELDTGRTRLPLDPAD